LEDEVPQQSLNSGFAAMFRLNALDAWKNARKQKRQNKK